MKFSKTRDVKSPNRANSTDAGIDFFVPNDAEAVKVFPGENALIPSGIKVDVPEGFALIAFNKSGISTKKELQVGACVVDCGYQGEMFIHLFNYGNSIATLSPGDKIVQFVLLPLGNPYLQEVPEAVLHKAVSTRGEGGFGSSGEK